MMTSARKNRKVLMELTWHLQWWPALGRRPGKGRPAVSTHPTSWEWRPADSDPQRNCETEITKMSTRFTKTRANKNCRHASFQYKVQQKLKKSLENYLTGRWLKLCNKSIYNVTNCPFMPNSYPTDALIQIVLINWTFNCEQNIFQIFRKLG